MTAVDHKNFTTVGQGLWWAVQTVTTVGYGDMSDQHLRADRGRARDAARARLPGRDHGRDHEFVRGARHRGADEARRRCRPGDCRRVRDINERLDRMEALLRERS